MDKHSHIWVIRYDTFNNQLLESTLTLKRNVYFWKSPELLTKVILIIRINICVNFRMFNETQIEFSVLLATHSFSEQLCTRGGWIQWDDWFVAFPKQGCLQVSHSLRIGSLLQNFISNKSCKVRYCGRETPKCLASMACFCLTSSIPRIRSMCDSVRHVNDMMSWYSPLLKMCNWMYKTYQP